MKSSIALLFLLAAHGLAQGGNLTGTVRDDTGKPVAGASVSATMVSGAQPAGPAAGVLPTFMPRSAKALSDSTGGFEVEGLLPGTYQVCAEQRAAALLNPCVWSDIPALAPVTAGNTTKGLIVVLERGVTVTVRVADANGLLAANPGNDDIRVGIASKKIPFVPALVDSRDAGGKTLSLIVPAGKGAQLKVAGSNFRLTDDQGNAVSSGVSALALSAAQTAGASIASPGVQTAVPALTLHVAGQAVKP